MLLKNLYDYALSRGLLADEAFQDKPIRWIIPIDGEGNLVGAGPIETQGEKNRGKNFSAPRTSRPKNAGGVAEFLADSLTPVFGLEADPTKVPENKKAERDANNKSKQEDFWRQIREAHEKTNDPDLPAVLSFHEKFPTDAPFLRWGTNSDGKGDSKPCWWVKGASGIEAKMGPDQFTFQVGQRLLLGEETRIRPYWREVFAGEKSSTDSSSHLGVCLVSGETNVPIAATHLPKIKGVPNTQSFGAAIVSFDKPSFTSFGFDQSANSPVSTRAVAAYCNALNELLRKDDHNLKIGDSVICFWAKDSQETSGFFARMLTKPEPDIVKKFLASPWAGLDRALVGKDRFFSVTMSGNAGRIVIRNWLQTTVEAAFENLRKWFSDLEIVTIAETFSEDKKARKKASDDVEGETKTQKMPPLAIFRMACATVRDAKELKTDVPIQLYRAALEGTAPSISLLKPILDRLQADLVKYGAKTLLNSSRFSLMKLILNRWTKDGEPMIETKVFDTDDPAYNCGRLLAVFDDLQMAAHDWKLEGAGVVERYYGTASSAPNSAFGILWRLHQHHLKKISRSGDRGKAAAEAIRRRIAEITVKFQPAAAGAAPAFPRVFNLQEQGRFALGFYQQKAAADAARREAKNRNTEPTGSDR